MRKMLMAMVLFGSTAAIGCASGRTPGQYADDTKAVVVAKTPNLTDCYNAQLAKDRNAAGSVAVTFTVQKGTGAFTNVALDEGKTSASSQLKECVMGALQGLVLAPPDEEDGMASYVWDFSVPPIPIPKFK